MVKAVTWTQGEFTKGEFTKSRFAKSWFAIGVGLAIVSLTGCQHRATKQASIAPPTDTVAVMLDANGQPLPPNAQPFLQPTVPQLQPDQMPTLPIRGLTPATRSESRLSQLSKLNPPLNGRDPFSALGPGIFMAPPTVLPSTRPIVMPASRAKPFVKRVAKVTQKVRTMARQKTVRRPQSVKIAARPQPNRLTPRLMLPAPMPIQGMPAPDPIQVMPVSEPLPAAIAPSPLPAISATSLADRVEISGVMQVGNRTMVIAKAENDNSARYLQAGDALAGGQVHIKSIQVSSQGEPTIVLEQNGVEVTKSVTGAGAANSAGSATAALQ